MADSQPQQRAHEIGFGDAEACSKLLDSAWREEWQQAEAIVSALATRDDLNVVDLGAGTGYFTTRLAKVLPNGKLLALDTEQSMVDWVTNLAAKQDLKNITARVIPEDDPKLEDVPFKFDILLAGYVYHHMGAQDVRVAYFRDKVKPKMPEGAIVVVVDFEEAPDTPGMPEYDHGEEEEHVEFLKPEQVKAEFSSAGFTPVTHYDCVAKPNYMISFKVTE